MGERATVLNEEIAFLGKVDEICSKYGDRESLLIQILLEIQNELNWLPREVLYRVSERLQVPLNRLYEIATFYKVFSLVPKGRNEVTVCTGTACHVRKAPLLINKASQLLGINPGETSGDHRFTLETVGCLGCCALAPVIVVNDHYYSNPTTSKLEELFDQCE